MRERLKREEEEEIAMITKKISGRVKEIDDRIIRSKKLK
jgi:hypothetical protein